MRRSLAALALCTLLVATACEDGLSPASGSAVRSGTLIVPDGRAAAILAVVPADAADSLVIGPPRTVPGAYFTTKPVAGRIMIYAPDVLTRSNRFRLFLKEDVDASVVRVSVVSTASPDGAVRDTADAYVALD